MPLAQTNHDQCAVAPTRARARDTKILRARTHNHTTACATARTRARTFTHACTEGGPTYTYTCTRARTHRSQIKRTKTPDFIRAECTEDITGRLPCQGAWPRGRVTDLAQCDISTHAPLLHEGRQWHRMTAQYLKRLKRYTERPADRVQCEKSAPKYRIHWSWPI